MRPVHSLSLALENLHLPEGFQFYDVGGEKVFAIYRSNGSPSTMRAAYIFKREYDINFDQFKFIGASLAFSLEEMNSACNVGKLQELAEEKLSSALTHLSDFNGRGGDMPPIRYEEMKSCQTQQ